MGNVFPKEVIVEMSTLDIVRETLDVNGEGNVSFRCRIGRGSGKAVEIPGSQFDEFVNLLTQTRDTRDTLAQQWREADAQEVVTAATATETETVSSEDE